MLEWFDLQPPNDECSRMVLPAKKSYIMSNFFVLKVIALTAAYIFITFNCV